MVEDVVSARHATRREPGKVTAFSMLNHKRSFMVTSVIF